MDASAWVSVVAAVLSVVAVAVALRQNRYARREATLSALIPLYESFHSDPIRRIRGRVYRSGLTPGELTGEDEQDLRQLLNKLEFLGALVANKLVDLDVVRSIFHHSVTDVWPSVRAYIHAQRTNPDRRVPRYAQNYEALVKKYDGGAVSACHGLRKEDLAPYWELERRR